MKKLWLVFTQAVTVSLAALLVVQTLWPELLDYGNRIITFQQTEPAAVVARAPINSYSEAVKLAIPAVVNISTSKAGRAFRHPLMDDPLFRHFFGDPFGEQPQAETSLGSGVIVSADGLILTNHHVIEAADAIEVSLPDGRTAPARVVGSDPETDLAVLRINLKDLPSITFGHSEELQVGDVVLAIGNPFGFGQTVTQGIVSALGRSQLGISTFENFIQTDASINPGNSGGALIDARGYLVGINSAIYSRSGGSMGIGFAIPVSLARQVMEQIVVHGSVTRGWVGIEAQDITPELAESFRLPEARGALIAGVVRGGPADKAGVRPGDVLVAINDAPVSNSTEMLNLVVGLKPEQTARLTLVRGQQTLQLTIVVGRRPLPQAQRQ